ncbi:hypothetical protein AN958_08284 [Leucoagaricus sp. SymC.cos]|nr:hypothetical protein AN958_08284 [Leucoagaricus sp. SymC.cos]
MIVNDTPYDVWSVVSTYLPSRDVEKLCGVSRQLRPVGLDARFREVKFSRHDSKMKRLCEMLGRDEVAIRVRRLTIEPWLVQPRTKTYVSKSENLWNRVNTFFNPKYMEEEAQKRVEKRINKDIRRVTGAVKRLENIHDYQILYDERSTSYHRQLVGAFLSPALEAFGSKLISLTIKVPFEFLQHLSYVRLPQLRSFNIYLCTGDASMEQVQYSLDGFFVFIHNLRDLEHLGISATSSSRDLDLSYFSNRWGVFPRLKSFALSIPFNGGLLSSPEDFYRHVMEPHARTLEKLKLSTTHSGPSRYKLPPDCHLWIRRILKSSFDAEFPRLREVELALRPLKAELTDLHTFLGRRAPILEKLTLTDRALNDAELVELFQALCPSEEYHTGQNTVLGSLKIKVAVLSPQLLLLVAQKFPRLKSLCLTFADVAGDAQNSKQTGFDPQLKLVSSLYLGIFHCCSTLLTTHKELFEQALQRPYTVLVLDTWCLRNLDLANSSPTYPWVYALKQIFLRNFPSTLNVGELPLPTN